MDLQKRNASPSTYDNKLTIAPQVLIMLVSIAVVIAAVFYVRGWEKEKLLKEFNFSANTYQQLLEGRLTNIVTELESAKRFFQGSTFVDRTEFATFILTPINNSSEIRAVSWLPRISSDQRRPLETSEWKKGLGGRKIHDPDPSNPARHDKPSPSRKFHFPILYAEPAEKLDQTISFDLASSPTILALLEQARDEGIIVPITGLSSSHLLIDENIKRKSHVSLIQPVYQTSVSLKTIKQRRDEHHGFLVLQYDIGLALEAALSSLEPSGFDIYIVDVEADDGHEIVYHHRSRLGSEGKSLTFSELWKIPEFIHKSSLSVSGRQWKIMTVPLPQYFEIHKQYQSWGVLFFGLILSGLLSYVAFANQRRTDVIRETVKSKTKELSFANEALQKEAKERRAHLKELEFQKYAIDQHAIVSITDVKGTITYANEKFCQISGYSHNELIGQNHRILLSGEHPPEFFEPTSLFRTAPFHP